MQRSVTPYGGPITTTVSDYDDAGNLIFSQDADGNQTYYKYTTGNQNGLPNGLLLQSYTVAAGQDPTNPANQCTTTLNAYYSAADTSVAGALLGKLKYTIDAAGQETYYAYDALGRTILSYTLKKLLNPDGTVAAQRWVGTTSQYDALGRVTATYQGDYTYGGATDSAGNPVLATSLNGGHVQVAETPLATFNGGSPLLTVQTAYTPDGQVDWTSDQYGAVTRNTYDAKGNLVRTLYPDGTEVRTVYDADGHVIWQTDRYKTSTSYNASTGVWTNDNTTTAMATYTVYDSMGRVVGTYRMSGVLIVIGSTTFTTSVGTVSIPNSSLSSGGTQVSVTNTVYNDAGQVAETDSPSGLRTGTLYYPDGQVQCTGPLNPTAPSNWYDLANASSYFTSTTSYLYNQLKSSAPFSGFFYDRVTDANGHHTDTYKDALGRTICTIYDDGSMSETIYSAGGVVPTADAMGNQLTLPTASSGWIGSADANGNLTILPAGWSVTVQVQQYRWGTDAMVQTYSVYDAAGRLVDEYQPAVQAPNGQSFNPRWQYGYDAAGNELWQIDPDGNKTTFSYDEFGHELSRTLPEGQAGGLYSGQQTESFTYDSYGREQTHTDFDGQMTLEVYDNSPAGDGRLSAEYRYAYASPQAAGPSPFVVPSGFNPENPNPGSGTDYPSYTEKTLYTYDSLGRQQEVADYSGFGSSTPTQYTSYTYDPITGNVASITTPQGTVNYVYDPATGNKVRMWTGTSSSSPQNDTAYTYDSQGQLTGVYALTLNGTVYGTYTGISAGSATYSGSPLAVTYGYDLVGNLTSETDPGGMSTTNTYNDLNRLTDITTTVNGNDVFSEHYDLWRTGQRADAIDTRYTTTNGSTSVFSQVKITWTYDALNRLTDEYSTAESGGANAPANYHDHFVYDLAGNRTEEDAAPSTGTNYDQKILYSYNKDNELTLEQTDNTVTSSSLQYSTSYTYDRNGSMLTQSRSGAGAQTDAYQYDLRNRMTQASITLSGSSSSSTTDYVYDTSGTRAVESTIGGSTVYYLNDPENPTGYTKAVQEMSTPGGTPARSYLLGLQVEAQAGRAVGVTTGPTEPLVYIHDGHGSTRTLIDTSGNIQEEYNYDAFGNLLGSTGAQANAAKALTPWLYADDGLYDVGTGWTYNLNRWRDGFTFTQMDSVLGSRSDPISLQKYIYSDDDPIGGIDPSGHDTLMETLAAIGIDTTIAGFAGVGSFNAYKAATAKRISKNTIEPGGSWLVTNSGLGGAFMNLGGSISSNSYIGLNTGNTVTGYTLALSLFLPTNVLMRGLEQLEGAANGPMSSLVAAISQGNIGALGGIGGASNTALTWLGSQLSTLRSVFSAAGGGVGGLLSGDAGQIRAVMGEVTGAMRQFATDVGGILSNSDNWGGSLFFGGGKEVRAPQAGDFTAFSVGASGSAAGLGFGGFVEGNKSISIFGNQFLPGASYVGAGLSAGIGSSANGSGVNLSLSFFLPTNLYDWSFPADI